MNIENRNKTSIWESNTVKEWVCFCYFNEHSWAQQWHSNTTSSQVEWNCKPANTWNRYIPEKVKVVYFYIGQSKQGRVVYPSTLNHHLHQIGYIQSSHQPAMMCCNIQHCLIKGDIYKKRKSIIVYLVHTNKNIYLMFNIHEFLGFTWRNLMQFLPMTVGTFWINLEKRWITSCIINCYPLKGD